MEREEISITSLSESWGTLEHMVRLASKPGFRLIGYKNLIKPDGDPLNDEIAKIKGWADSILSALAIARAEVGGIKAKAEARARAKGGDE